MVLNSKFCVITNNILVKDNYNTKLDITFVSGQYIDVLKLARDMVHRGYKLITHPLAGSIKPNETPYRSIILSEGTTLDLESLSVIESSIASAEKFLRNSKAHLWDDNVLKDFRFVDLKLFESALESIG